MKTIKTKSHIFSMLLVLLAMLCAAGCTKPDDGGNNGGGGNGGNGGNNGGSNSTDYASMISNACWSTSSSTYQNVSVSLCFDSHNQNGSINFFYGGDGLASDVLSANGTYSISGNMITATYTDVKIIIGTGTTWHYGHTYGFVNGQGKTVTYTIQSCTENRLVVKESAMGETLTLEKEGTGGSGGGNGGGGNGGGNNSNLPVVETDVVNYISYNKAVCFGNVISGSGFEVTERGLCWSTHQDPTISDNKVQCGNGLGEFIANLTNLNASSTYYVRAYAINTSGVGYSEERSFLTSPSPGSVPEGAVEGVFSISPTQRVWFSKGNLQYQASTNTWRFAENQYDFVGGTQTSQNVGVYGNVYENGVKCDNSEISSTYSGWIDLFGWGTSGYNHNNTYYQPWSTDDSGTGQGYYAYGIATCNLYDKTGQADWGYHAISNGGNTIHSWKTLSREEWDFVLKNRDTYTGIRYAKAILNEVKGVVLLPDDWSYTYYQLNSTNVPDASFDCNVITSTEWINTLQAYGAVFLPISGGRANLRYVMMSNGNLWGRYWSSSCSEFAPSNSASCAMISESHVGASDHYHVRGLGYGVRLVHIAE